MAAKDYRNGIITLVILGVAVKGLSILGKGYILQAESLGFENIVNSIDSISNLFLLFTVALIIIFIPLYLSKRSSEKKKNALAVN